MNRRLERTARNEALIRVVNERIEQVDKTAQEANYDREETLFEFLCECGDGDAGDDVGCEAHIEMTIREYEAVRSQDDRFALYPGHEQEAIESVAARNKRFVVVDKRPSVERFVADDPRGAPSERGPRWTVSRRRQRLRHVQRKNPATGDAGSQSKLLLVAPLHPLFH